MTTEQRSRIFLAMAEVKDLFQEVRRAEDGPLAYVLGRAVDALEDANDIAEGREGWRVR